MALKYSPRMAGLDGLRGLALAVVVLFHMGVSGSEGGLFAIPFFFVLSGYLITRQLQSTPIHEFYWRRAVRIIPPLYLYLAANLAAALYMGWPLAGYLAHPLFASNLLIADTMPHPPGGYIVQLWTVAIEVQFYIIWPILVLALGKRVVWLAAAALVAAPLWRWAQVDQYAAVLTLPSTADMFAAGIIVAFQPPKALLIAAFAAGLAIVCYCFTAIPYSGLWSVPGWQAVAPLLYSGCALLFGPVVAYIAVQGCTPLAWRPLAYLGRISYSIYLWHLLMLAGAAYLGVRWMGLPLVVAFAAASWRYLEEPAHAIRPFSLKRRRMDAVAARPSVSTVAPPVGAVTATATGLSSAKSA